MDERDANIDLLFRNGLKDYEALPPQEAWEKINPVIRKRQKPVLIFRAAATFAILISMGLLAYRWSNELSEDLAGRDSFQNLSPVITPGDQFISEPLAINIPLPEKEPVNSVQNIVRITDEPLQPLTFRPDQALVETGAQYTLSPDRRVSSNAQTEIPDVQTALSSLYLYPDDDLASSSTSLSAKKWSVSALVSPSFYDRVSSGNNEQISQVIAMEHPQISYTGGVALAYKVNRRFSVQSGIYYSSIAQKISGISAFSGFEKYDYTKGVRNFGIQTANGTIYTSNGDVFLMDDLSQDRIQTKYTNDVFDPLKAELEYVNSSLFQNFSYLELPVFVKYKVLDRTIDLNVIGGFSSNVLVNNSVYTPVAGGKYQIGNTDDLNNVTFSSSLGMGMEYSVSGNLSLNLEPTFRYYLNPFSQLPGMKIHPYSFGIFSGLTYKF